MIAHRARWAQMMTNIKDVAKGNGSSTAKWIAAFVATTSLAVGISVGATAAHLNATHQVELNRVTNRRNSDAVMYLRLKGKIDTELLIDVANAVGVSTTEYRKNIRELEQSHRY